MPGTRATRLGETGSGFYASGAGTDRVRWQQGNPRPSTKASVKTADQTAKVRKLYFDRMQVTGNAAVLYVQPNGTPKFVESKDWGAGRGARRWPGRHHRWSAGDACRQRYRRHRSQAARHRFQRPPAHRLSNTLGLNSSAVVIELATDAVPDAQRLLAALGATQVVVEPIDQDVSALFASTRHPRPSRTPQPTTAESLATGCGRRPRPSAD